MAAVNVLPILQHIPSMGGVRLHTSYLISHSLDWSRYIINNDRYFGRCEETITKASPIKIVLFSRFAAYISPCADLEFRLPENVGFLYN